MKPPAPPLAHTPLPRYRRIGYGIGDIGFNLYFTTASLYLLFYYTDVLGLPPATAGWIFAGALIWDAIIDPLMGWAASRTRSRWGRYRPWLLWGAVPRHGGRQRQIGHRHYGVDRAEQNMGRKRKQHQCTASEAGGHKHQHPRGRQRDSAPQQPGPIPPPA
jgi:hypothetical protein